MFFASGPFPFRETWYNDAPYPLPSLASRKESAVEVPPESSADERARDRRARALFEAIDDAVFVHDLDGRILDANPAACRRLGYTREELLRLRTRDIDDPEFAADFGKRLREQVSTGKLNCEGRHRTKDGRLIPVDINTAVIEMEGR